jgi:hypothetical protein
VLPPELDENEKLDADADADADDLPLAVALAEELDDKLRQITRYLGSVARKSQVKGQRPAGILLIMRGHHSPWFLGFQKPENIDHKLLYQLYSDRLRARCFHAPTNDIQLCIN